MEKESFLTGYCRCIDQSRMVTVVTEGNDLLEVDCNFQHCIYAPNCIIAGEIQNLLTQGEEK